MSQTSVSAALTKGTLTNDLTMSLNKATDQTCLCRSRLFRMSEILTPIVLSLQVILHAQMDLKWRWPLASLAQLHRDGTG